MKNTNKKILIIKPPYTHIPVGIAYVLSCLEQNNIPFDFIDTLFTRPNYSKLLKKNNYLAFATGGLISNFKFISQTVKEIRSIKPDLPIIIGGNITKDSNQKFLFDKEMMGIDFGIIGEAETSLPYLINELNNGSVKYKEVPGLLFKDKDNGEIIKNHSKRLDLGNCNILPAWHYVNVDFYKHSKVSYMYNQLVLPVLTGRGCVGSCTFCSPTVGTFQKRPIEHVIEEIEFLFSRYNFNILHILNEVFYLTKEDILKFCKEYKKLKNKKPWMCGMRVDVKDIDYDTFVEMKDAGCILAGIGIESGSNYVLNMMKKRITKDHVINFCRRARKAKLPTFGTFMIGNEGEKEEDIRETIDMVINEEMNTDASLTDAYPGTQIYKNAFNKGLINDEREYYKNVHFTPGLYDMSWENRERYLNVSRIPNDCFWEVLFTECRRFYTFSFNRFKLLEVKYKIKWLDKTINVIGICSECGNTIKVSMEFNLLGQMIYCSKCYSTLYLNYYELDEFSEHFKMLKNELKNAKKIVVTGIYTQAMNILHYDHFNLNYKKIEGFLDFKRRKIFNPLFAYMPRIKMEDILNIMPDTILVADDPAGNTELKLRLFYFANKIDMPKILHLIPDKKRFSLIITRYFEISIKNNGIKGVMSRLICKLIMKWMRAWQVFLILRRMFLYKIRKLSLIRKVIDIFYKVRRHGPIRSLKIITWLVYKKAPWLFKCRRFCVLNVRFFCCLIRLIFVPINFNKKRILGIWDYKSLPWSVGDPLVFIEKLSILKIRYNAEKIDICIIYDRDNPSGYRRETNITCDNVQEYMLDFLPLFSTCPDLGSIYQFNAREEFYHFFKKNCERYNIFPSLYQHLSGSYNFFGGEPHVNEIQEFYNTHGYIPYLRIGERDSSWARWFYLNNLPDKAVPVTLSLKRTSHDMMRNADSSVWLSFIDRCKMDFPEVVFVVIGLREEVFNGLRQMPNVIVAKDYGTTLIEDFALIRTSLMYMGMASGINVIALFSDLPYLIFRSPNVKKYNLRSGENFSFSTDKQKTFGIDTFMTLEFLLNEFKGLYYKLDKKKWFDETFEKACNKHGLPGAVVK